MKQGKSELPILIDGETILVLIRWWYSPELRPTFDNPYGEPYDFTYEIIWHNAPQDITEEQLMDEIDKISIFEIMEFFNP
jgi:hypothetical protein